MGSLSGRLDCPWKTYLLLAVIFDSDSKPSDRPKPRSSLCASKARTDKPSKAGQRMEDMMHAAASWSQKPLKDDDLWAAISARIHYLWEGNLSWAIEVYLPCVSCDKKDAQSDTLANCTDDGDLKCLLAVAHSCGRFSPIVLDCRCTSDATIGATREPIALISADLLDVFFKAQ